MGCGVCLGLEAVEDFAAGAIEGCTVGTHVCTVGAAGFLPDVVTFVRCITLEAFTVITLVATLIGDAVVLIIDFS